MTTPTNPEVAEAVRILREDAILAHNDAMAERMERMEQRISRMPVAEMTAEEKAAEYDRLMAEQNNPKPPSGGPDNDTGNSPGDGPGGKPIPPPAKPPEPSKPPKRDRYWGDALNE